MTVYLDVGVQRIGEYLTRVPHLRQLRQASGAISASTDTATVTGGQSVVSANTEAGDADGVLHLIVTGGSPVAAATEVLAHLRRDLPGAHLRAAWAEAADYPSAHEQMQTSGEALEWLPSTNEFPIARPCGGGPGSDARGCGQRPGGAPGAPMLLCPDCQRRDSRAALRDGRAESLLAQLGHTPRDLKGLCPSETAPPQSNHVASIAMDGNGVGSLFSSLLGHGDAAERTGVSTGLVDATVAAYQEAAAAVRRENLIPVVPVILGGDDVTVIVAAADAWTYVQAFQQAFAHTTREKLGDRAGGLSMSAGVVFHHVKQPITRTIAMADDLMRHAKDSTRGERAAVSWVDTTNDSIDEGLEHRPVVAAATLAAHATDLTALAGLRASTRTTLNRLMAEFDELPISDADRHDALRHQADRVGALDRVRPFPYPENVMADRISLPVALDLAGWWR